jgi:hypothetical protein
MNLSELIAAVIAKKKGNKEFILSEDLGWNAGIGNPVTCVALGESSPEYSAIGETPEEAVRNLLEELP